MADVPGAPPPFEEGWRFDLMRKLVERPHKHSFEWNQLGSGGSARTFTVQKSTIPEANWGLFADAELASNADLVVGNETDQKYNLDDIHAKFGNKIFLQDPDEEASDFSAAGEERARNQHAPAQQAPTESVIQTSSWYWNRPTSFRSFSAYVRNEGEFDDKMERALKLRWASRVRDWNRAVRASKLPIQELNFNNGVDPYVLATTPAQGVQSSGNTTMWAVDIYDPFNAPLGFLNHPLRASDENITFESDGDTARIRTLKVVGVGQEFFWNYGGAYTMETEPDITHFHLGRKAVAAAMLGAPPGGEYASMDAWFVYPTRGVNTKFPLAFAQKVNNNGGVGYYSLKCAWEPYWTLNEWQGVSGVENVPWSLEGIQNLLEELYTSCGGNIYRHFERVVDVFFAGTRQKLSTALLTECRGRFSLPAAAREALETTPSANFQAEVVRNEKGQNIIGCSFSYSHDSRDKSLKAAELFFFFEEILPPDLPPQTFSPPTPDQLIAEGEWEDNAVLRRDLRDDSKDVAALMEHLRDSQASSPKQKSWHDVLVRQKMVAPDYPTDNGGMSFWRKQTGEITLSKNTTHSPRAKWLSCRWDQAPGVSVYFVVDQKNTSKNGVRVYFFHGEEAIERATPGHVQQFFRDFSKRDARFKYVLESNRNIIKPRYLDVVKSMEAPVWVSLVLKGVLDPASANTTAAMQRWGADTYEKAVLEIAVEQSLVKLRLPASEDRLYWRQHQAKKGRRDRQKRLSLKLGWLEGTLEERRRGIQKVVAHQKCPELSELKNKYVTHASFARSLRRFKK